MYPAVALMVENPVLGEQYRFLSLYLGPGGTFAVR